MLNTDVVRFVYNTNVHYDLFYDISWCDIILPFFVLVAFVFFLRPELWSFLIIIIRTSGNKTEKESESIETCLAISCLAVFLLI